MEGKRLEGPLIWVWKMKQAGVIDILFECFDPSLRSASYLSMLGLILKATQMTASKQCNTNAEQADLRARRFPGDWRDKPAQLSHKDHHARWTLKNSRQQSGQDDETIPATDLTIPVFGYKSHVSIDLKFRFTGKWKTTDAAASDGARLREGLLEKTNTTSTVWADTAYRAKTNEAFVDRHGFVLLDCNSRSSPSRPHLP